MSAQDRQREELPYANRPDTMHEDEKLIVARAISDHYTLQIYDLDITVDDLAKTITLVPRAIVLDQVHSDAIDEARTALQAAIVSKDFTIEVAEHFDRICRVLNQLKARGPGEGI